VHEVHARADKLNEQEAWRFAGHERLAAKLQMNLAWFERALGVILPNLSAQERQRLWPEGCMRQLGQIMEAVLHDDLYRRAFDARIVAGAIRKGHGDIKAKNIWFSDYYRTEMVRSFKDCLVLIDAIDFEDSFSTIDTLSEAAMLTVDLQLRLSPGDYAQFLHYYIRGMPQWRLTEELVFAYYLLEKAIAITWVAALLDEDQQAALAALWQVRLYLQALLDQVQRTLRFSAEHQPGDRSRDGAESHMARR